MYKSYKYMSDQYQYMSNQIQAWSDISPEHFSPLSCTLCYIYFPLPLCLPLLPPSLPPLPQIERVITIMQNPRQYKIPDWFLNRQKDIKDGKYSQVLANQLDNKLREDLERMKKMRAHRGLRHYWG